MMNEYKILTWCKTKKEAKVTNWSAYYNKKEKCVEIRTGSWHSRLMLRVKKEYNEFVYLTTNAPILLETGHLEKLILAIREAFEYLLGVNKQ